MGASLDLIHQLGPGRIEARVLDLAERCSEALQNCGAEVEHGNTPIITARFPGRDASALALSLKEQRIIVSARHGRLRVSTHFYNDQSDIDALAAAI
jgi:cysteine desulfurase / selenocysteine lyase